MSIIIQIKTFLENLFENRLFIHNEANVFQISDNIEFVPTLFTYITFCVTEDKIFVFYLTNKFGFSGKKILNNIEILAKHFGIHKIVLDDSSTIQINDIKISLFMTSLIKYNESYYGKLGYSSNEYQVIIDKWSELKKQKLCDTKELCDIQMINETIHKNINLSTLCNLLYQSLCDGNTEYYILLDDIFRFIKIKCMIPDEIRMFKYI